MFVSRIREQGCGPGQGSRAASFRGEEQLKSLEQKLGGLAQPVLSEMGLEMVDLEMSRQGGRLWVRMFVDRIDLKNGGVTAQELGDFNREISRILDVEEVIPESYLLEVSSPGIKRRIRKLEDFKKFLGQKVIVEAEAKVDGRRKIRGILTRAEPSGIEVEDGERVFEITHDNIARAMLDLDLNEAARKGLKK